MAISDPKVPGPLSNLANAMGRVQDRMRRKRSKQESTAVAKGGLVPAASKSLLPRGFDPIALARGLFPSLLGPILVEPEIPTKEELRMAEAYVDPSRLILGWSTYPFNPSTLVTRKGLQVYDAMKRDEQVKAALWFKKSSVLSSGWEIVSPGDEENDWEPTRFVQYNLQEFIDGGFHRILLHKIMSSLDFGYSCLEKIYEDIKVGEFKGKAGLKYLNHLKPHYINFMADPFGKLIGVRQLAFGKEYTDMPPGKFVIYSYQKEFENFYGVSDLECCYRAWWAKDNTYKWLAVTLERYGMPPLFALYNPNAYTGEQVKTLNNMIKNIQNATIGVIPRADKDALEFWNQDLAQNSTSMFLETMKRFDGDISRGLLVPGLIGMTPDESGLGSFARSETHFNSFMQVVIQIQNDVATNVINEQIIPQLCDLNYPGMDSYPKFQFLPFRDDTRLETLKTWQALVTGKIVNRVDDDEEHIRKMVSFPPNEHIKLEPLPEDDLLKVQMKKAGMGGLPGQKQQEDMSPVAEHNLDVSQKLMAAKMGGEWVYVNDEPVMKVMNTKRRGSGGAAYAPFGQADYVLMTGAAVGEVELSQEARQYATDNQCIWRTINGARVCIKPTSTKLRVQRALASHKPARADVQDFAKLKANGIIQNLGAKPTDNHHPMDVILKINGKTVGLELKVMTWQENDKNFPKGKLTVHTTEGSLARKLDWGKRARASIHTIAYDGRSEFGNGAYAKQYSGNKLYYREGVGSFAIHAMTPVRNLAQLKQLISASL